MELFFESDIDFVLESGFVYVPLLLDPDIEREAKGLYAGRQDPKRAPGAQIPLIIESGGARYIRALRLESLVKAYRRIHERSYGRLKAEFLLKYSHLVDLDEISIDKKLRTIIFEIMPHFVRRKGRLQKRGSDGKNILDLIADKISIPDEYYRKADAFLDRQPLERALEDLEHNGGMKEPPGDGPISSEALRGWLYGALERQILEAEKDRLKRTLLEREQLEKTKTRHAALLLFIADKGSLEMEGFGFIRTDQSGEYLIYKRTGEYGLKDFQERIYIFPDCRVAVSSAGPIRPEVLDTYKHPLLLKHDSRQKICVRRYFVPATEFNAKNVINGLEEGINALYYGYSGRRRNGFHRLDPVSKRIQTIDFDDYMVAREHPKIASGRVEIKNDFY